MMIQLTAGLQPLVVGAVLLWTGGYKLFGRTAADTAERSALAVLLGTPARASRAFPAIGVFELSVGALVVLPPSRPAAAWASAGLAVGFLGYLGYARLAAPARPCGCAGAAAGALTWRSFGRAAVLLGAALAAAAAHQPWHQALAGAPLAGLAVLAGQAALLGGLSPELDRWWLRPLRLSWARLRQQQLASTGQDVPLDATVHQLHHSEVYRQVAGLLRSDVQDTWDQGEWRLVSYGGVRDGRPATVVFAVPKRDQPDRIRVAVVEPAEPVRTG